MNKEATPQPKTALWISILRWTALLVVTAVIGITFDYFSVPAAYLLGALACGAVFALLNHSLQIPKPCVTFARGIIGAMIAGSIPITALGNIAEHWFLFILGIGSVQLLSNGLGIFLSKGNMLPGSTAIWGVSPGAASAMVIMAENFDADVRLVALMQYLRVVIVSVTAILVTHYLAGDLSAATAGGTTIFDHSWYVTDRFNFIKTLGLVVLSLVCSRLFRIPSGPILITLALGLAAGASGILQITLPLPLLTLAYLVIGWDVGFRFNRPILCYALKVLPHILLSIVFLVLACSLLSCILVFTMGIEPLTAYLAMSPGGLDTIAIIAASGSADMSFVMTMQTARLVLVIIFGPMIARLLTVRQHQRRELPSPLF